MKSNPFDMPNHDPNCKRDHLLLRVAYLQPQFVTMPPTWYWHVMSPGPSFHSTLSMDGLKHWGLL